MSRWAFLQAAILLLAMVFILTPGQVTAGQVIAKTYPTDNVTVKEMESVVFVVELAQDVNIDNATVLWYKNDNPVIASGLSYTYLPDYNASGNYKITVIVIYNATTSTHQWNLTVQDLKQKFSVENWDPAGDTLVRELEERTFSVTVKNPANDSLTYRWFIDDELQLGMNASSFTFKPGLDSAGERQVRLVVQSSDNSEEGIWKVIVRDALEVRPDGDLTVREGDSITFTVLAPEIMDSSVVWHLDGSATPMATGKSYTYKPDYMTSGQHTIKVNTTDGLSHEWAVKVEDVDRPPTITDGKTIKATEGEKHVFRGVATDPDNDILSYEWDFDGDGTFDFTSDREEAASHTYKRSGTYLATFRVTDAHGETATRTYPVQVSRPKSMSPWLIGSIVLGTVLLLVVLWVVYDVTRARKRARLEAEARAREKVEVAARAKARAEAARTEQRRPKREELPLFEDVPEPAAGKAVEHSMVPYQSKMADRGLESEGAADEGEIAGKDAAMAAAEGKEPQGEVAETAQKAELDDILKSLSTKASSKAELKSKRASAEVGAQDIDHDIVGPGAPGTARKKARGQKGQPTKKPPKKEPAQSKEQVKAGSGKGADSDIAPQASDEVDVVMQRLVDMGLAERRKKRE